LKDEIEYAERFERRVVEYLEMHDYILVGALNRHYTSRTGVVQAKLFDLRALTEAISRSNLDASEIVSDCGQIPLTSSFRLEGKKIIREL